MSSLRIYRSRNGRTQTTRYFVDKFPPFLSGASIAPAPVVTFCYVDGNLGKPAGFDTHLLEYRELSRGWSPLRWCMCRQTKGRWRRLNASSAPLRAAGSKICEAAVRSRSGSLTKGTFGARVLLERRETACFDKQQLDRLRDELREFRGPEHEELY
jgi:hypothetical protein